MSRRARVPGPLRRLSRERSRLVAILLLAVVALAASGIQSSAAATLQATLDANWRGAYDILVTSAGSEGDIGGLLAPNSLASGDQGMTLADLDTVRAIAGVEVAAPIGEIVAPGLKYGQASITIPQGFVKGADASPQAFRVRLEYSTDDGLGARFVAGSVTDLVVDETPVDDRPTAPKRPDDPEAECQYDAYTITEKDYPDLWDALCQGPLIEPAPLTTTEDGGAGWGTSDTVSNGAYVLTLGSAPQSLTRITLVDPVAEQALLGSAGDFLAPLQTLDPDATTDAADLGAWAEASDSDYARDFEKQEADRRAQRAGYTDEAVFELIRQLYADNGADLDAELEAQQGTYVPLLVSDAGSAPLTARVTVEPLGEVDYAEVEMGGGTYPYQLPTDAPKISAPFAKNAPTSTADISAALNPFVSSSPTVPWPGSDPVALEGKDIFNSLGIQGPGTITGTPFTKVSTAGPTVEVGLGASGFHNPIPNYANGEPNPFALTDDATVAGTESAYVEAQKLPASQYPGLAVPVGSFRADAVAGLQSELSYVPLGAYEAVGSTLADGTEMNPTLSGLGLVGPRTVAIASIYSADAWNQKTPVSAVRVRVAGIDGGYSADARNRVIAVASAVEDLGFTATIVAGSSPTDVTVHVDDYAFGVSSADESQKVGPLGDVVQAWSELGAAARADLAISTATASILGIALGSTALLLGAVQFASIPRRRAQAEVMREVGFTRRRIARWMAAEEVPGLLIVVLAGISAALLSGLTPLSLATSAAGVAVVLATSTAAVALGSRTGVRLRAQRHTTKRVRGRRIDSFGARQGRIHAVTSSTHFLAILIVALSAAALASVFLQGRADAGSSLLGQFTVGQSTIPQLVLGLTGIAAGLILSLLGRRVDLARRSPQWAVMRAMGWTTGQLRRAQRTEALTIVVPAVVVGAVAAWSGASLLAASDPGIAAAVALVAGVCAALVIVFVGRKAVSQ